MTIASVGMLLAVLLAGTPRPRSAAAFFSRASPFSHRVSRSAVVCLSSATSSKSATVSADDATASTTTSTAAAHEAKDAYAKLVSKLSTITQLQQCQSVLGYDQLVFMPTAAAAQRGAQLSALATVIHQHRTDPALKTLLEQASQQQQQQQQQQQNGSVEDKDMARLIELETKAMAENERIPAELAARAAALGSSAYAAWVQAKQAANGVGDFEQFCPVLQECFDTAMELAKAKRGNNSSNKPLYTQMLDEYEVGMPVERIDEIFDQIQTALVPLIEKVVAANAAADNKNNAVLEGNFAIDQQQAVARKIVEQMGFDMSRGRIDVSVHPFTSSASANDVRITSRFKTTEWYQGLAAMMHEAGHALYEQNVGPTSSSSASSSDSDSDDDSCPSSSSATTVSTADTSLDTPLSMGTHESQSLFWERHVGLSKPFWEWALPLYQQAQFGSDDDDDKENALATCTVDDVYRAVNTVQPSLIRVEADELTYPLHVILRYHIERDVISGELKVQDIPARWKDDMQKLLQVHVPHDAAGCLQDVHWASLAFGYFPTYLVGSATAAQLAHYCAQDMPEFDQLLRKGEFDDIKAWLVDKVHRHGQRYPSLDDLLLDQVGEKLNPAYFIDYLTKKYTDLYNL